MRQFLILFAEFPIDKTAVKKGQNSPEVITACRCVNVGLFLSGNLRRDVIVSIAIGSPEDLRVISFPGESLKRVSPDERSISFFLLKSVLVIETLSQNTMRVLDNGIIVSRDTIEKITSGYDPQNVFFAEKESDSDLEAVKKSEDTLLIYTTGMLIDTIGKPYPTLPRPPHPERFMLDVNESLDCRENEL